MKIGIEVGFYNNDIKLLSYISKVCKSLSQDLHNFEKIVRQTIKNVLTHILPTLQNIDPSLKENYRWYFEDSQDIVSLENVSLKAKLEDLTEDVSRKYLICVENCERKDELVVYSS